MSSPSKDLKKTRSGSSDVGHKAGHTTLFSGMQEYKRDSAASSRRRESIKDQSTAPQGLISNMWNSTFKGAQK